MLNLTINVFKIKKLLKIILKILHKQNIIIKYLINITVIVKNL